MPKLTRVGVNEAAEQLDSATPRTVARQAPPSMGFSRQEYWSGLPFPFPGDRPDPGFNPGLPHCRQILYLLSHRGSPSVYHAHVQIRMGFVHVGILLCAHVTICE